MIPMYLTVTPNPCIDKTIYIPRFKPGDRVRSNKYTQISGGKGNNVARILVALGFRAAAILWVGGYTGKQVVKMLREDDKVKCFPVWTHIPTRTITTVLEEELGRQTAFFEPGPKILEQEYNDLIERFKNILRTYSVPVVTFSGTVPDPNVTSLYKVLIDIANKQGSITILDSYGNEFSEGIKSNPFMVKPNVEELSKFIKADLSDKKSRIDAVQFLKQKYNISLVVLSMGAEGAFVSYENTFLHFVPPRIKEINPVGSGDALVAGFAVRLAKKFSIYDTGRLGIALGTANAMMWDIGKFDMKDLMEIYEQVKIYTINPRNNQKVQYKEHTPLQVLLPGLTYSSP